MSGLGDTDMEPTSVKKPLFSRLIGTLSGLGVLAAFCLVIFLMIGFIRFGNLVSTIGNEENIAKADGIVVLTGGKNRISAAVSLLQEKKGSRLLISGVHPDTSKNSIAKMANIEKNLLDCCIDIDRLAMDTKGNASQTANWAATNNFTKIIIVTSNYHMPRSLLEMHDLMPNIQLVPYVVDPLHVENKKWYSDPTHLKMIAIEYAKYMAASFRKDFDHVDRTLTSYASSYSS